MSRVSDQIKDRAIYVAQKSEAIKKEICEQMKGQWQKDAKKYAHKALIDALIDLFPLAVVIEVPESALIFSVEGNLIDIKTEAIVILNAYDMDIEDVFDWDAGIWNMDDYEEMEQMEDMLEDGLPDIQGDVKKILHPEIDLKVRWR